MGTQFLLPYLPHQNQLKPVLSAWIPQSSCLPRTLPGNCFSFTQGQCQGYSRPVAAECVGMKQMKMAGFLA